MRHHLVFLGLWLALSAGVQAAAAYPLGAKVPILSASACANKTVSLDFTANGGNGVFCLNGQRYSGFTSLPGASVSRASSETCVWADGHLTTASSNQLCVTDLGAGIWESRTNLFLNSLSPVAQTITLGATGSFTISVWGSGSVTVAAGTATITNAGTATVGSARTINCTATGTITVTVTGSPTEVQVELGAFWTPPITTTGSAATRAADNIQITNGAIPGSNVTFWGKVYRPVISLTNNAFIAQEGNATAMPTIEFFGNNAFAAFIPLVGAPSTLGGSTLGFNKFAAAFSNGHTIVALNGVLGTPGATTWTQGTGTTLSIGQAAPGTPQYLNGYVTSLSITPVTLSDGQVQALSQ